MIKEKEMFEGLMNLVDTQDGAFYKVDSEMGDIKYRVFNYRIPSWTQMNLPFAQESRGVMFDITVPEDPKLVCLTPKKFFNYKEGKPKEHEKYKMGVKMQKVDGSLLSSFEYKGKFFLKSKTSISSTQVKESLDIIYENENLLKEAIGLQKQGWTLNFEYISPNNIIVVPYEKSELVLLSARSMKTGELIYADKLEAKLKENSYTSLIKSLVKYTYVTDEEQNQKTLLEKISKETEGEGYVIEILAPEPYMVKVKNDAYSILHNFLGKMDSDFQLAKVIISEKADDARSVFRENPEVIERLDKLEKIILPIYNAIHQEVESFFEENKNMEKKEYVAKAQENDKNNNFSFSLAPFKIQRIKGINNIQKFCLDNPGKVFNISENNKAEENLIERIKPRI